MTTFINNIYTEFECPSLASLDNRTTIYNKSHGPNPTKNILLMLDSKRQLVVLTLHILLSNKKSLEMVHIPKMELGIKYWNSSTGSLIGIFKYIKGLRKK